MDLMIKMKKMRSINAFLIVARTLFPAVKALTGLNIHPRGHALLAAHSLECILKALLLCKGVNETEIYNFKVRHNLECMWRMAFDYSKDTKIPVWVYYLSIIHNSPYYGRYQQDNNGNAIDAITYPPQRLTTAKLENILKKANKIISRVVL